MRRLHRRRSTRGRSHNRAGGLALAAALWLPVGLASAATSDGQFAIKGVGLMTCQQYLERREEPAIAYSLAGWADGFVTALNQLTPDTFDHTPWQSADLITRILTAHCETHADDRLAGVAASIIRQFAEDRLTEASVLVAVSGETRGLLVYQAVLDRVRDSLAARGLLSSPDGDGFDAAMRDALRSFQRDNGLPDTGIPDTTTLWLLFHPPAN